MVHASSCCALGVRSRMAGALRHNMVSVFIEEVPDGESVSRMYSHANIQSHRFNHQIFLRGMTLDPCCIC